jgi:serine phosphatase RsbU (regulator of sigma subunit)
MSTLSLRQIPLFSSLAEADLAHLATILRPREVEAGEMICREGQRGDRMYIILAGQVQILKTLDEDDERLLNLKGPGDFIGEMSLFDHAGLRTASARAATAATVLEMTHVALNDLLRQHPELAYEVVRELSLRLRDTDNAVIRDLQEKNLELEKAYRDLLSAQAQVIEKEKLEHELQVAWRIQKSILPSSLPRLAGFDFGARIQPARAVGGDFFDLIPLSSSLMGLAIGDVSDKGVPAAIFMALTRSLIRAEANAYTPPCEVLRKVNAHLLEMNEAGMFVTVLYGILDASNREFIFARAGHEIPWVFDSLGNLVPPLRGRGQPLGILPFPYLEELRLTLKPGETLLLYTDGLPDSQNTDGQRLGYPDLQKLIAARLGHTAQGVCDAIVEALCDRQGSGSQTDDITLITIQTIEDISL